MGVWCKRAAWLVVVFALINIGLNFYAVQSQYTAAGPALTASVLAQSLRLAVSLVPSTIFWFFILYAAGVLIDHVVVGGEADDIDEAEESVEQ